MKKIIEFIKANRTYSFGYGVTFCTFFSYNATQMDGYKEGAVLAVMSVVVALTSWCYPIARVINTFFPG